MHLLYKRFCKAFTAFVPSFTLTIITLFLRWDSSYWIQWCIIWYVLGIPSQLCGFLSNKWIAWCHAYCILYYFFWAIIVMMLWTQVKEDEIMYLVWYIACFLLSFVHGVILAYRLAYQMAKADVPTYSKHRSS